MNRVFSNSLEERVQCARIGVTEEVFTEFRINLKTRAMKSRTFP